VGGWVRFRPDRDTAAAAALAVASVAASFAAGSTDAVGFFVARDLVQVIGIGLAAPFALAREGEWVEAGVRFDRPWPYLAISTVLGGLLLVQFASEPETRARPIDANLLAGAAYVMVTNVFEVLFFACFLRARFERAFGIVAGIVLASGAYSLHHAGFQPEYAKLWFVGLGFLTILRMARHWLVLFPLWWVGGLGDVLFRSTATAEVDWLSVGSGYRAALIAAVIIGLFVVHRPTQRRREPVPAGRP